MESYLQLLSKDLNEQILKYAHRTEVKLEYGPYKTFEGYYYFKLKLLNET